MQDPQGTPAELPRSQVGPQQLVQLQAACAKAQGQGGSCRRRGVSSGVREVGVGSPVSRGSWSPDCQRPWGHTPRLESCPVSIQQVTLSLAVNAVVGTLPPWGLSCVAPATLCPVLSAPRGCRRRSPRGSSCPTVLLGGAPSLPAGVRKRQNFL